ncbi:S8 family peptidase [Acetobacteraceae bacterium]|nr:S8 family peptidase [Acetobacteraceae bacterium]
MAQTSKRSLPLLFPKNTVASSSPFSPSRNGGGSSNDALIQRNRRQHAQTLTSDFKTFLQEAKKISKEKTTTYLTMEIASEKADILGNNSTPFFPETSGLKLVNTEFSEDDSTAVAATFLLTENGKKGSFPNKLEEYASSKIISKKDEQRFNAIERITETKIKDLFSDKTEFPIDLNQQFWWELWINKESTAKDTFQNILAAQQVQISQYPVSFVESDVFLICASITQLQNAIFQYPSVVTGIRKYREMNSFFLNMRNIDQKDRMDDLKQHISVNLGKNSPTVCILDSGVFQKHPLIEPFLEEKDCQTTHPDKRNTQDLDGHGTAMAGTTLYGDLSFILKGSTTLSISYNLESLKIYDPSATAELSASKTNQAISLAESNAPNRKRLACMALTDEAKTPEPSSWSAGVDHLAFGKDRNPYLFIISAGNIYPPYPHDKYLVKNDLSPIQNPAQAWNALTVGAYTEKCNINDPSLAGYKALAPIGDLSPYSSTSLLWNKEWPIKPEIVMEGGNYAIEPNNPDVSDASDDLRLLTTAPEPKPHYPQNYFALHSDTSAATALASKLAAELMAEYPDLSPQAIRCLIVHSARWTSQMEQHYAGKNKGDFLPLLRRYGYGVPSLERASKCLKNDATLLVENAIQPFPSGAQNKRKKSTYHEMILHDLPWPKETLEALEGKDVRMRVTLSYFIEPNPNVAAVSKKFRAQAYRSFGLHFDVKRPDETQENFKKRVNTNERAKINSPDGKETTESPQKTKATKWKLGIHNRNKGSIHSDIWEGTGPELAACGQIAIYPVGGWWTYLQKDQHDGAKVAYALAISLETSENIDLYTEIKNQIDHSAMIQNDIFL